MTFLLVGRVGWAEDVCNMCCGCARGQLVGRWTLRRVMSSRLARLAALSSSVRSPSWIRTSATWPSREGTHSVIPCREGWGWCVDERCQGVWGAVRIVLWARCGG